MRDFVYIPCVILALFASLPVPSRALPDDAVIVDIVPDFVNDSDFHPQRILLRPCRSRNGFHSEPSPLNKKKRSLSHASQNAVQR